MAKQRRYHVVWEIDTFAISPAEAARECLALLRDLESSVTTFTVIDEKGNMHIVDAEE